MSVRLIILMRLDQILRLLSASGYVLETAVQTYQPSPLTMVMADPTLEATTRAWYVHFPLLYSNKKQACLALALSNTY